jgi:N6-L-threonylcarbamoyladenine synthase
MLYGFSKIHLYIQYTVSLVKILGIETSCDETSAAVVENGEHLLSVVIASSMDLHAQYGGVIPEIAARSHIEVILPVVNQALSEARCSWTDIDGIAVTYGAGLSGCLLIGVLTARTLAITLNKPLYAINHVEAHVYANFLTSGGNGKFKLRSIPPKFPMLALIVSGGHSQLVLFSDHFKYRLLGQTQDDAIGEAFDKVAKILGLPYPGGPSVEKMAKVGDVKAYNFPVAKMKGYDLSFSGLKTAVLRASQSTVQENYDFPSINLPERLNEAEMANLAASFMQVAFKTVIDKVVLACQEFSPRSLVIAGGVAANSSLREQLATAVSLPVDYPDPKLCTDNAAMVASIGSFKVIYGQDKADPWTLSIEPDLSM